MWINPKSIFTTKCAMSLRSSAEDENGGISLHRVLPSTRHSRARGNPGWFSAELAWIPAFAGMTEPRRPLRSHSLTKFSKEFTKDTKVSDNKTCELYGLRDLRDEKYFTAHLVNTISLIILSGLWIPSFTDAAQSKPLIKVVAGYGSTDGAIAPLWFAKETRLFEKRGLDVLLVGMGTGSVSLRALIAKDLEIASLSGSGLVQAALQGADTVILSAAINGFIFKVFGAPEMTSPAHLKGKKLGVSRYGATSDFAIRLALKKWGLNPDRDVSILQVGTTQDTVRAMQTKMLDAGVLSGTASLVARKAGFRELGDLAELGLHYPMAPIGTTRSYLQKNEAVVKEFMLAYIEAIRDYKRNKEAALAVLKKYTRNDDREVLEDSYSNNLNKYLPLPIPTREGIQTILAELASTVPAAKNADPEQFVAYKIAREIEASGFVKKLYEK